MDLFKDSKIWVATKHAKEKAIEPVFQQAFHVGCERLEGLDTDQLGTFSGEVERKLPPLEAAREKCRLGHQLTGKRFIMANEGSFGNHPLYFTQTAGEEILVLMDFEENREFKVKHLTTETNFNELDVETIEGAVDFMQQIGFPAHGLILQVKEVNRFKPEKGLKTESALLNRLSKLLQAGKVVRLETDMRAMYNPTRMEAIKQAAFKMVELLNSPCPKCSAPGFGVEKVLPGLPCSSCGYPTRSVRAHLYHCSACGFQKEVAFPNGKTAEDPMFCDHCNP